jgi:hypothetical protein
VIAGWLVFCHEVRLDSIRPCRRLTARGLVGEPDVCRPEIVVRRAASWMPIGRPQGRDAREPDRAATFGRARYQFRRCEDDRRAAFG